MDLALLDDTLAIVFIMAVIVAVMWIALFRLMLVNVGMSVAMAMAMAVAMTVAVAMAVAMVMVMTVRVTVSTMTMSGALLATNVHMTTLTRMQYLDLNAVKDAR